MSSMTLKALTEKLDPSTRSALEQSVALCCQRSHYTVEVEHYLKALIDNGDTDIYSVFSHYDINIDRLNDQLNQGLDTFKTGNDSTPSLSPRLVDLLKQCWLDTSIEFSLTHIRGATLLFTLLADPATAVLSTRHAKELNPLDTQALLNDWPQLQLQIDQQTGDQPSTPTRQTNALKQFTIDLTQQAKDGLLDPVLGRDDEIRQAIDILLRRRQNNPILTGEAGVGKTAVAEGLAQRISDGRVPDALKNARLLTLDLALLQAGAGVKGEFENRLKNVIEEVKQSIDPVILFIDEAHNMVGAGGQAGQNDAANLLKPALARGELRTIAATTWAEYKKYFEKDAALSRRFQVVKIEEPSIDVAIQIMRGLQPILEKHHGVSITDDALRSCVNLSKRYLPSRQLPDKAVALLDTACARVAMSQAGIPSALERVEAQLTALQTEAACLESEQRCGINHSQRRDELIIALEHAQQSAEQLQAAWHIEKELVTQAHQLASQLNSDDSHHIIEQLNHLRGQLNERVEPLVHWQVDDQLIAEVLADWTGIPLGRMQANEVLGVLSLGQQLQERVRGQDHAIDDIARTIQIGRANLGDEKKPLGVFLLVGPSGVGKTETAMAIAEQVYGSEDNITVINMSEFKEEHKVSQLMGSPAGYVGYGEGGVLTNAVRRKPYSVILLDEMEKAHPGVQDIFYQVFDKGSLRDGEGEEVDFKNTIILMTSNAASDIISDLYADELTAPNPNNLKEAIWDELLTTFKPAFLGRTSVLPFRPLARPQLQEITQLQLARVSDRVKRYHNAELHYDDAVIDSIVDRCQQSSSGARNIQQILQSKLLPTMAEKVLQKVASQLPVLGIQILVDEGEFSILVH